MQPTLPNGFISIEDAVKLINSDTRTEPKVDTKWLVSHIDWIEEKHNFRIPLIKLSADKTKNVRLGSKFVEVRDDYDKAILKRCIRDHYRDLVGRDYQTQEVKAMSSVVDDEVAGGARPRRSKPIAKVGATIESKTVTTNGEGM